MIFTGFWACMAERRVWRGDEGIEKEREGEEMKKERRAKGQRYS